MVRFFSFVFIFVNICYLYGAPIHFVRQTLKQADGSEIECFSSGDEFYNWLHTKEGYTIVENEAGYYVFADKKNNEIVPTNLRVDTKIIPQELEKWLIDEKKYQENAKTRYLSKKHNLTQKNANTNKGTMNNIVVFVEFADDNDKNFNGTLSDYSKTFNSEYTESVKNYYKEVSYSNFIIKSHFYPKQSGDKIISYVDKKNRASYLPYSSNNPKGYKPEHRELRELELVENVLASISNQIPESLNIDYDEDGKVDNIMLIIKGGNAAWGEILWAHQFHFTQNFYNKNCILNGKTVDNCIIIPENQAVLGIICHELFHSLGAPDLYRYTNPAKISPVYVWDIMGSTLSTPQSMGAYMKYRYGNWIDEIPLIFEPGTYSLEPITSENNNCYQIPSNNPDEYFVVEYRKPVGKYESQLDSIYDGKNSNYIPFTGGLLVYKIDKRSDGVGNKETLGNKGDEVYVYRPNGNTYENGEPWLAPFNEKYSRDKINSKTNPAPILFDESDGGLNISDIYEENGKLYFTLHSNVSTYIKFPKDGAIGVSITPKIVWDLIAEPSKYVLQVSNDNGFSVLSVNDTLDNVGSYQVERELTANQYYYLKVGVLNKFGNIKWAPTVIFKTAEFLAIKDISGTFCAGETIQVEYDFWGDISPNNTFDLLISDKNGKFGAKRKIASIVSNQNGVISAIIPDDITSSRLYRLKIVSSISNQLESTSEHFKILAKPVPKIKGITEKTCLGTTVKYQATIDDSLNEAGYAKFEWEVLGGNILEVDSLQNTIQIMWRSSGPAKIMLTATNFNGCQNQLVQELYISEYPNIVFDGKKQVCAGEKVAYFCPLKLEDFEFNILGGQVIDKTKDTLFVVWGNEAIEASISIKNINENYCDTTFIFPVQINIIPQVEILGVEEYCKKMYYEYVFDTSLDTNNYEYLWEISGGVFSTLDIYSKCRVMWEKDECEISLTVIDKNTKCQNKSTKKIIKLEPPQKPLITLVGEELHSSEADFYQWILDNEEIPEATTQKLKPTVSGDYQVKIRNNGNNCESISDVFSYKSSIYEENELDLICEISDNYIKVKLNDNIVKAKIELVDVLGRLILSDYYNSSEVENWIKIPTNHLKDGIYFLRVSSDKIVKNQKIIICR